MIGIILFVEIVIQTIALLVAPTQWWIWQLLGFITATNLGAGILAVVAQKPLTILVKTQEPLLRLSLQNYYFTVEFSPTFRAIESRRSGLRCW